MAVQRVPESVYRLFFVAGEASGDTHGANLITALKAMLPGVECTGLGGQQMAAAGMALRHDLAGEAIMGFAEVVRKIRPIRRLFMETLSWLEANRPDCVVLIDYPGFNIRLAKELKARGIPVIFYISPQIWAWKKKRIHTIAACGEKMLVIFPFEEALYRAIGMDCRYVGHPLLDHIGRFTHPARKPDRMTIGLLPGSRTQEIRRILPAMMDTARGIRKAFPEARFCIPCVDAGRAAQIEKMAGDFPLEIQVGGMYDILAQARFCMVTSGTATLETALFGVPMAIAYRTSLATYLLARTLVKLQHIGIVNILAERSIVPEFIQQDLRAERMLPTALELIRDTPARAAMIAALGEVREKLGSGGASRAAAEEIRTFLEGRCD
ncbi:MAG: lipid-A-disaccharide synthase [Candidatus Hydrogenedentes bacterium]|nr:lipid-A-disaccharide synthase [Candidatus Hydrogenedentota bacterium]